MFTNKSAILRFNSYFNLIEDIITSSKLLSFDLIKTAVAFILQTKSPDLKKSTQKIDVVHLYFGEPLNIF